MQRWVSQRHKCARKGKAARLSLYREKGVIFDLLQTGSVQGILWWQLTWLVTSVSPDEKWAGQYLLSPQLHKRLRDPEG